MEKYDRINLDEYIQTGEGGTAVSYIHRGAGDTLVKLYTILVLRPKKPEQALQFMYSLIPLSSS